MIRHPCCYVCMPVVMRKRKKNADEESFKATLLTVQKYMAKPRIATSARRKDTNRATSRSAKLKPR
jgi:hypothetical protein